MTAAIQSQPHLNREDLRTVPALWSPQKLHTAGDQKHPHEKKKKKEKLCSTYHVDTTMGALQVSAC